MSNHFLGSRASARTVIALEDKWLTRERPPYSSPPAVTAEHNATWHGTSLQSVWVTCPSCVPSQSLAHPQPTGLGGTWRDSPEALQALLTYSHNTEVLIAQPKTKSTATVRKVKPIPGTPSTPDQDRLHHKTLLVGLTELLRSCRPVHTHDSHLAAVPHHTDINTTDMQFWKVQSPCFWGLVRKPRILQNSPLIMKFAAGRQAICISLLYQR